MEGQICRNCGEPSVITDPDTHCRVCESCGLVHCSDVFQDQAFAPDGTLLGTLHTSGDFGYRERKIYRARALIADITSRLNLTDAHATDVARLACKATDDNLGSGDWFPVLVTACAVIVMRQHGSPLSLAEAAEAIARDPHDLGRMIGRVARHLDLGQLPELDAVCLLERAVHEFSPFSTLDKDKLEEILGQGRFILHCAIRWFLTTGRHPLPVVAAVLAFVSRVNALEVGVEDIAGMIHAGVATSHRRLKELMEVLVKVGKRLLPWGSDVTVKNIVHNAPVLIRFMELKSKAKLNRGGDDNGPVVPDLGFNLHGILNAYSDDVELLPEESKYVRLGEEDGGEQRLNWDDLERLKLSAEGIRHSDAYDSVLDRIPRIGNEGEIEQRDERMRRRAGLEIDDWIASWKGRWKSDKGLTLEQVLQRSEGFDALPPSFIKGTDMRRMRRMKMEAAKHRICRTMKKESGMVEGVPCIGDDDRLTKHSVSRKRKRDGVIDGLDWEDCIIELLLLRQADEEEIEQGHYNRLLDLYVFSSSDL